ncbi:DUF4249 domain-containing protein [Flavilitoribacter nigricans]|uniref:DUF4249 family protein n=1 Tax=Flavilitoribacter nigricans (strain ATCC 23147 / DSM 23189 / NBRC 102662 / NCIMB 1420 / SS-2) TaxID=1122177 RepID=A0A2D0N7E6_FLAN2|nr:DUF4249 domain-containing protein [Flavilitoribacter nigricans]PHN04049.1 hypothetical protein CRP01_22895 [Flavilitoribacter nigricans DSM 23189 = NBRC 102662]
MRTTILFLLLISTLTACRKVVDYQVDFPGEQLAIVGTVSTGAGANVYVSRSIAPYGSYRVIEELMVTDAEVYIYGDTLIGRLEHRGNGRYTSTEQLHFSVGGRYWVEVIHDELGTAYSSSVTIPENILQFQADLNFTGAMWPSNEPEAKLTFSLLDRPGENYYTYFARPEVPGASDLNGVFVVGSKNFEFCGIYNTYMLDTCFDGEPFSLDLHFGLGGEAWLPSGEKRPFNSLRFRLTSVSAEYYLYLLDKRSLESGLGVADPTPTFTNITGGLGVFMAANEKAISLGF